MSKKIFRDVAKYQRREKELEQLAKVWFKLPSRACKVILVAAGVWSVQSPYRKRTQFQRSRKGEAPTWLMPAMNILKDTNGHLSDREIARRVGVAHSTLIRHQTYLRARKAYSKVSLPKKVVTRDPRLLSQRER